MPYRSDAVSPALLGVLDQLNKAELLSSFYLVGGTALALHIGHRRSVDIDLFTHEPFDSQKIAHWLNHKLNATEIEQGDNLVRCFVDGVKVDILAHQYPLLEAVCVVQGIRITGVRDIAAMKLNAIANRGARKDFWDVGALLDHLSLAEMLECYKTKYRSGNVWAVVKSLDYFEEADAENIPIQDLSGITWELVKQKIRRASRKVVDSGK